MKIFQVKEVSTGKYYGNYGFSTGKGRIWRVKAFVYKFARKEDKNLKDIIVIEYDLNSMTKREIPMLEVVQEYREKQRIYEEKAKEERNWVPVNFFKGWRNSYYGPFEEFGEHVTSVKELICLSTGYKGYPNLGEGLRFKGSYVPGFYKIHKDDSHEFKVRIRNFIGKK